MYEILHASNIHYFWALWRGRVAHMDSFLCDHIFILLGGAVLEM